MKLESRPHDERKYVLPRSWYWNKGLQARELRIFLKNSHLPSVKLHALRACFATQLLSKNVPPAIVMKILLSSINSTRYIRPLWTRIYNVWNPEMRYRNLGFSADDFIEIFDAYERVYKWIEDQFL